MVTVEDLFEVVGTTREPELDQLAIVAAGIFEAPYALITFLDGVRVWIKSAVGLPENHSVESDIFWRATVEAHDPLVIEDAQKHFRFKIHPWVQDSPNIRFFAGVPLIERSGALLGTLSVMAPRPHSISNFQKTALISLSAQIVSQLQLRLELKRLERKRDQLVEIMEKQKLLLLQNSKLAALGQMSAQLAHEILNPLTVLNYGLVQLDKIAHETNLKSEKIQPVIKKNIDLANRVIKITKGIKSLGKQGSSELCEVFKIQTVIDETLAFCMDRFNYHSIHLKLEIPPDLPDVKGNPTLISQVLLNLLNNAFDAIEGTEEPWIKISAKLAENKILLEVSNGGLKIPEDLKDKIFQAFFTTKHPERGSGLGLSISKEIMANQGGDLRLSERDSHTCFEVWMPVSTF